MPVRSRSSRKVRPWALWLARSALLAVVALACLLTLRRFDDYDVLWHVRTGEWIASEGQVPRTDPFGAPTAGRAWIDVAWGAQVIMAWLSRRLGLSGLQLVVAGAIGATLITFLRRGPLTLAVLAGSLLFTLTSWQRFLVRPDLLTLPLTVLLFYLVDALPRAPLACTLALAALSCAWANLHGSFVLVPLVLAASTTEHIFRRREPRVLRARVVAGLVCLLATLANPYGPRLYELLAPYLRTMLSAIGIVPAAERLFIREWMPTWSLLAKGPASPRVALPALVLLTALSFFMVGRGLRWARLLSLAPLALLCLVGARHLLPFAAAALCVIVLNERDRLARHAGGRRAWRITDSALVRAAGAAGIALVAAVLLHAVLTDRFYVRRDLALRTGVGLDLELLPDGAAQWLAAHDTPGLTFNNFDSGAYLLYRLYPRFRPYSDARVVDPSFLTELQRDLYDLERFEARVAQEGIGTIVLSHPTPESVLLLPHLARDPGWRLAYRDHNSTIHVRADLSPPSAREEPWPLSPIEDPLAARLNGWLVPLKREVLPAAELTDAFISGLMGDRARQLEATQRALARAPGNRKAEDYLRKLAGL